MSELFDTVAFVRFPWCSYRVIKLWHDIWRPLIWWLDISWHDVSGYDILWFGSLRHNCEKGEHPLGISKKIKINILVTNYFRNFPWKHLWNSGGTCFWCDFTWNVICLNVLMLQKQVQTLPVNNSNNSKTEDRIILLIISIWNTSFKKIQSNISSNNSKMSKY